MKGIRGISQLSVRKDMIYYTCLWTGRARGVFTARHSPGLVVGRRINTGVMSGQDVMGSRSWNMTGLCSTSSSRKSIDNVTQSAHQAG